MARFHCIKVAKALHVNNNRIRAFEVNYSKWLKPVRTSHGVSRQKKQANQCRNCHTVYRFNHMSDTTSYASTSFDIKENALQCRPSVHSNAKGLILGSVVVKVAVKEVVSEINCQFNFKKC